MKIPGRPVQPDGRDPETVRPGHILFQIISDHHDPPFVRIRQPQLVHCRLEHGPRGFLLSHRLRHHPGVEAALQAVFPVYIPEGFLPAVRYESDGITRFLHLPKDLSRILDKIRRDNSPILPVLLRGLINDRIPAVCENNDLFLFSHLPFLPSAPSRIYCVSPEKIVSFPFFQYTYKEHPPHFRESR